MSLTITQARDEILALFMTAWNAQVTVPPVFYWDITHDPPVQDAWARIIVQHITGQNDGITNRRFSRTGVVTVQIFTRFGAGLSQNDTLTKIAADAFQGKATPGGAWFRNVRLREIGQDGQWFHSQVLADFEYTEVI